MEFIARQPIVNGQRSVTAYERLYRNSEAKYCAAPDLNVASRQMTATVMLVGFDTLSSGHAVYINCTEELLCGGYPTLFPAKHTVIEVLETKKPTSAVVTACRELKAAGYAIALDDFDDAPEQRLLVELADILNLDFRPTSSAERAALVDRYGNKGRLMLAEKVETDEEFSISAELADIHGQHQFKFQHAAISAEQSKRFLDWAFWRDFEKNGPSLFRMRKRFFEGWKRYKHFPDARVRRRFADELFAVSSNLQCYALANRKEVQEHQSGSVVADSRLRKEIGH